MSETAILTGEPEIENLLDKYGSIEGLIPLALGSSYWTPPEEAMARMMRSMTSSVVNQLFTVASPFFIYSITPNLPKLFPFFSYSFPPSTSP